MNTHPEFKYGFTIIELVVVAGLLGILAGVNSASFFNQYENDRMRAASKIVESWISSQRKRALQDSSQCTLTFSSSTNTIESDCDGDIDTFVLNNEINDGDEFQITMSSGSTTWIFSPRGTTRQSAELRLSLKNSGATERCLKLEKPLGQIKLAKLNKQNICDYTTIY